MPDNQNNVIDLNEYINTQSQVSQLTDTEILINALYNNIHYYEKVTEEQNQYISALIANQDFTISQFIIIIENIKLNLKCKNMSDQEINTIIPEHIIETLENLRKL
ncbi:MAG: hypothetical protein ATN36_08440 [Epulopiscium sp. Nele67-Bin005]|nr:MAG: hypothetical protein ATN36_08440 [Epulopiscium sp. Nele67-Bin005]